MMSGVSTGSESFKELLAEFRCVARREGTEWMALESFDNTRELLWSGEVDRQNRRTDDFDGVPDAWVRHFIGISGLQLVN